MHLKMFHKYKFYRNKICSLTRRSDQQYYFTAFDVNLTQLLKCSSIITSEVLPKIINSSILNGLYPSKLKVAKIVPVNKADDGNDVKNYRSISLLYRFNRIVEKNNYLMNQ